MSLVCWSISWTSFAHPRLDTLAQKSTAHRKNPKMTGVGWWPSSSPPLFRPLARECRSMRLLHGVIFPPKVFKEEIISRTRKRWSCDLVSPRNTKIKSRAEMKRLELQTFSTFGETFFLLGKISADRHKQLSNTQRKVSSSRIYLFFSTTDMYFVWLNFSCALCIRPWIVFGTNGGQAIFKEPYKGDGPGATTATETRSQCHP